MGKKFGANTKISVKVGQLLYRQTRTGTVISELPVKPAIPRRSARQMDRRTQWGNLAAIYKQFDSMLRRGYENLPPQMSVFNAFIQANIDVVKVYITKTIRLNGGAILAPYQITRGSLPSISMAKNASNILVSSIRLGAPPSMPTPPSASSRRRSSITTTLSTRATSSPSSTASSPSTP